VRELRERVQRSFLVLSRMWDAGKGGDVRPHTHLWQFLRMRGDDTVFVCQLCALCRTTNTLEIPSTIVLGED